MSDNEEDIAEELYEERQLKIQEYERFVNEVLKQDLKKVLDYRDKILEQMSK